MFLTDNSSKLNSRTIFRCKIARLIWKKTLKTDWACIYYIYILKTHYVANIFSCSVIYSFKQSDLGSNRKPISILMNHVLSHGCVFWIQYVDYWVHVVEWLTTICIIVVWTVIQQFCESFDRVLAYQQLRR